MAVDVIVSSNNVTVTTAQKTLVGSPGTAENTDASYSLSVPSGGTAVIPDITLTKNDDTTVSAVAAINLDLGVIDPAADGAVENTDVSYSDTVASGGTLVIPDINITKNDDSVVTSPAAIDLDLRIIDPSTPLPATWAELVAEYGQGYPYAPLTGQTTSYRTGDDANIESTIFAAARVANKLKVFNSLANFLVLNNNNSFGTTERYTDSVGGQDYDGTAGSLVGYIIDHFTGLGWFLEGSNIPWNTAIDAALASTDVGFSNWFLPNKNQIYTPFQQGDDGVDVGFNYSPFSYTFSVRVWASTTDGNPTTNGIRIGTRTGDVTFSAKTNNNFSFYCRKHF